MNTKIITIQGVDFNAPIRFEAGHPLTEAEARALNQTFHENLRNNFAKTVKAFTDKAEGAPDDIVVAFDKYAADYDFAMPGAGGGAKRLDPIEKEALSIAREVLKNHLAGKGKSMSPPREASDEEKLVFKTAIDAKIEELASRDEIRAAARKNVEARSKNLDKLSESLAL